MVKVIANTFYLLHVKCLNMLYSLLCFCIFTVIYKSIGPPWNKLLILQRQLTYQKETHKIVILHLFYEYALLYTISLLGVLHKHYDSLRSTRHTMYEGLCEIQYTCLVVILYNTMYERFTISSKKKFF